MMPAAPRSTQRSASLIERARHIIPGGVSSPVRAFNAVGGTPRFIASGRGAYIVDEDGNSYLDCVMSWGALALGHAHDEVVDAIVRQAARGTSFGAPSILEEQLAQRIIEAMPSIDMLRFVSTGSEATMSALRLARAATGRPKFLKFDGCYHGHADALLVRAGSGVTTLGLPDSPGVTAGATTDTMSVPYNDLEAVDQALRKHAGNVAAIIVEPVAGNMGLVLPNPEFLAGLRALCTAHGALLIFDEVMTGFRVARGGAQQLYNITPDLTCLGKIIGGGLPVAAYGGARHLMERIAPSGPVYQAGTLSGNPLGMAAGIATLDVLARGGAYEQLSESSRCMAAMFEKAAERSSVPIRTHAIGGMWGFFLSGEAITNMEQGGRIDRQSFARLFHALLDEGVYIAPSAFESNFVSLGHTERELAAVEPAIMAAFSRFSDLNE